MKRLIMCVAILFMLSGCKTEVEPGHIGICKDASGFAGKPLRGPGLWDCWGRREVMYYMETKDSRQVISIKVLAKDKLNMSFDISMLVSVNTKDKKLVTQMFTNISPDKKGRIISIQSVFDTYAKNLIDQEVRKVISQYETTEISDQRAAIINKIRQEVHAITQNTVIDVKDITINNLDFPKVVTEAQEIKKTREVEILTEKAKQKRKLLEAKNSLEIAKIEAAKQLMEAKAMADSNKILSDSITPAYLEYKRIEALKKMAKRGDLIFMPYSAKDTNLSEKIKARTFNLKVGQRIQALEK